MKFPVALNARPVISSFAPTLVVEVMVTAAEVEDGAIVIKKSM
jgi:hypothetical protein